MVWQGTVNNFWDKATANWLGGAIYSDNSPVTFDDTALITTVVGTNLTPASVTFNSVNNAYTIAASILGAGPVTQIGTGTNTLTGTNSLTGNITINGGGLTLGGAGYLTNGFYAGFITNNGTFIYASSANQGVAGIGNGTANGSLIVNGPGTLTISNNLANGAFTNNSFTLNGGTLVIASNTVFGYNVPLTVNGGTLVVNSHFTGGVGGAITVNGGTLAGMNAANTPTVPGNHSYINRVVTVNAGGNIAPGYNGATGGLEFNWVSAGGLNLTANSMVTFGINTNATPVQGVTYDYITMYTGESVVASGPVYVQINALNGTIPVGTYNVITNTGPSLNTNNYNNGPINFVFAATGTTNWGNMSLVSATNSNVLNLVVSSATTLTNAALTWNGNLSANWDTTTANWQSNGVTGLTYADGGVTAVTFDDSAAGNFTVNGGILTPAGVTFNNTLHGYTNNANIIGTGSLIKIGTNSVTFAATNGYSGGTMIDAGAVYANINNALGTGPVMVAGGTVYANANNALGTGAIALNNGLLVANATNAFGTNTLTANGGTISNTVNVLLPNNMVLNTNLSVLITNNTFLSGNISGAGSLISAYNSAASTGNGNLFLAGTNSFSGNLVVWGNGQIAGTTTWLENSNALPAGCTVILTNSPYAFGLDVGCPVISGRTLFMYNSTNRNYLTANTTASVFPTWDGNVIVTNQLGQAQTGGLGFNGPITLGLNNGLSTVNTTTTVLLTNPPGTLATNCLRVEVRGNPIINSAIIGALSWFDVEGGTTTPTMLNNTNNTFYCSYYQVGNALANGTGWLMIPNLASNGVACALGSGSTNNGTVANSQQYLYLGSTTYAGTLTVTNGAGGITDRQLILAGTTGGATLDASATGLVRFANTGVITNLGAGAKTLTLQGAGAGEIDGILQDNSTANLLSVTKTGTGTWTLTGINTNSGTITVSGGTLLVNGAIGVGTNVVNVTGAGSTLGGSNGVINAAVTNTAGTYAQFTVGAPMNFSNNSLTIISAAVKVVLTNNTPVGTYVLATNAIVTGTYSNTPVIVGGSFAHANYTTTIVTTSTNVQLVVGTIPDALALTVSTPNPIIYGNPAIFTATVQTNFVTAGDATGNVVFSVDGTPVGTVSLINGAVSYTNSAVPVGLHTIQAVYVGDANYSASTNSLTQNVTPAASTIAYGSTTAFLYNGTAQSPSISIIGSTGAMTTNYVGAGYASVNAPTNAGTYYVSNTVAAAGNYSGVTNTVTFTIGQTNLTVTAQPNTKIYDTTTSATNVPTLSVSLQVGDTATVSEVYSNAAVGTGIPLYPSLAITNAAGANVLGNYLVTLVTNYSGVINPAQATTSLVLTNNLGGTNYYGQTLIFTAVVQTNGVPAANATTNVIFSLGSTPVWTNALVSGVAYYTNSSLPVGVTNFTAQYLGDTNYQGSSLTVTQTVLQTTPVLTVTASNVTYGATLVNGLLTGSTATNVNNQAGVLGSFSFTTAGIVPNAGSTNVSVTFTPTDTTNYTTATTTVTVTVSPAASGLVLTSANQTNGYLSGVYFTATVPASATGTVTFLTNGVLFDTETLATGVATSVTNSNLPRGTNVITAQYAGDGNYVGSTNSLNQYVTNHPPVAAVMTVVANVGVDLSISLADLATNWTDVDGDPVSLTDVNLVSLTNGVNLTASNFIYQTNGTLVTIVTNSWSYIFYPGSSLTNVDQISYSITDGQGGTNIGYINLVLATNAVVGTNSIASYDFTNGVPFTLTAYGVIGQTYITQRSTNLTDWANIATNVVDTNGVINVSDSFLDFGGVPPSPLFYRLMWQAP